MDPTPTLSEELPVPDSDIPSRISSPILESFEQVPFPDISPASHKIDLRSLEHTTPVDENLICPVCRVAFVDPITTSCDHVFCRDCFDQSYALAKLCPIDRTHLMVPHDIGPTHRLILNQLDSLEVRCPNKVEGCGKILPRSMVQNHVSKYCDYTLVLCKDIGCGRDVRRKDADRGCLHKLVECPDCQQQLWQLDLEQHRQKSCRERKTHCVACGLDVLRVDLDRHESECEEAWTTCRWAVYGCPHRSKRKDLSEHKATCNFETMGPIVESMKEEIRGLRSELQFLNEKDRVKDRRLRFLECTRNAVGSDNSIMDISNLPDGPANDCGPYDSRDQYMLSLLEHQEAQVDRLSVGLTELEAKQTMMLFNETLPIKEQLMEIRSTQSTLGMHVRWLMQFRMRDSRIIKTASGNDAPASPGQSIAGSSLGPVRRLSDTMREMHTKL